MKKGNRRSAKSGRSNAGGRKQSSNGEQSESEQNGLQEIFIDELSDIYNAEQQLTKALPKMAKAAQSQELRQAFEEHLDETTEQISRLDQVFQALDETPKRKTCKGMQGLIEEGKEMMEEHEQGATLDAVLIASGQKVEHYEIASYGTLCTWAEVMGQTDALALLKENMAEEEAADEKLSQIAESSVNQEAQQS